jgi:hypothetical protein
MVTKKAKSSKELKNTSIELLLTSPLTEVCELKIDKKLLKSKSMKNKGGKHKK